MKSGRGQQEELGERVRKALANENTGIRGRTEAAIRGRFHVAHEIRGGSAHRTQRQLGHVDEDS